MSAQTHPFALCSHICCLFHICCCLSSLVLFLSVIAIISHLLSDTNVILVASDMTGFINKKVHQNVHVGIIATRIVAKGMLLTHIEVSGKIFSDKI